jgi:hypothetical protein
MWLVFLCLMSRVVLGLHVVACGGLMGRVVIVILRVSRSRGSSVSSWTEAIRTSKGVGGLIPCDLMHIQFAAL